LELSSVRDAAIWPRRNLAAPESKSDYAAGKEKQR
jgi:hypothetical protein